MPADVETMFSNRLVPWHGLGKIVDRALNSHEALVAAGLDWIVEDEPVYDANGNELEGYILNRRSSDGRPLGIVSDRYAIVQNHEAFDFIDSLIGNEVLFETAGSLASGKTVWMLARLQEHLEILGDAFEPYIVLANTHDGTGSVKVLNTPVRVVCQNTLNAALHEGRRRTMKRSWACRHVGDIESKLAEARRTLGLVRAYHGELQELAQRTAIIRVPDNRWKVIVEKLLPLSDDATPIKERNVFERRDDLYLRMFSRDLYAFRNTGWGAINAVSDFVAHTPLLQKRAGSIEEARTHSESSFMEIIQGHTMLDDTTRMVMALAP